MLRTNININYANSVLHYAAEYVDNSEDVSTSEIGVVRLQSDEDKFQFFTRGLKNCIRDTNVWNDYEYPFESAPDPTLPSSIDLSSVNIYFPQHSVETYVNNNWYAVEITTYINGDKIILGSFILDRRNAIAYPGCKVIAGNRYYEYINVKFPDPWRMTYSDEWEAFRTQRCLELPGINNTGSLIGIEINPITCVSDQSSSNDLLAEPRGEWHKQSDFVGGFSTILLSDKPTDYLSPVLSLRTDDPSLQPAIQIDMMYNEEYDQNDAGLIQYISETYLMDPNDIDVRVSMVLHTEETVYNYYYASGPHKTYIIDPTDFESDSATGGIPFTCWTEQFEEGTAEYWMPGLMFTAMFTIYSEGEPMVTVKSSSLPLTKDLFSKLVRRESGVPSVVQLNDPALSALDIIIQGETMTDISVVNKIVKQVINVKRPNDYRANMVRPVFIRVQDNASEITVHPGVTENIAVDLHKYKNNVENFSLKINGVEFSEIGRMGINVIFKVIGDKLPESTVDSIYYILDDNKELVTFGNYKVGK